MSKATILLFVVWSGLLVFWVVTLFLPDARILGPVAGIATAVCGIMVAFSRSKGELALKHAPMPSQER